MFVAHAIPYLSISVVDSMMSRAIRELWVVVDGDQRWEVKQREMESSGRSAFHLIFYED